jgi:acetyl-CoA C-acetyltransferase
MPISGEVAIIGTGIIKFGENFDQHYNDMLKLACDEAFLDANISSNDIQAAWLGTYLPFSWGYEGASGTNVVETLGLGPIPVTRVSNYCSTGMEAVRNAALGIAAGGMSQGVAVLCHSMWKEVTHFIARDGPLPACFLYLRKDILKSTELQMKCLRK